MIPVKEFHLVHATYFYGLEKILASGSLLSMSKTETESDFWDEEQIRELNEKYNYDKKVFTGLIIPNEEGVPSFTFRKQTRSWLFYLVLKPQVIKHYADCSLKITNGENSSFPHYCNAGWMAGSFRGCIKYDKNKSLKSNLNEWRNFYLNKKRELFESLPEHQKKNIERYTTSLYGTPENEIAIQFSKNKKGECIEGEIPLDKYLQAIYVYQDEALEDEIKELASKYPQYNWIFG